MRLSLTGPRAVVRVDTRGLARRGQQAPTPSSSAALVAVMEAAAWCPKTPLTTWRRLGAVIPVHLFVVSCLGWLQSEQHEIIQYLREENRVLKEQLRTSRTRFTDDQRRRLAWGRRAAWPAALDADRHDRDGGHALALASAADRTEVDVLGAPGGPAGRTCSRRFGVWSCGWQPRIPVGATCASKAPSRDLGHRVARSTVATILKQFGVPPSPELPTSWQTFLPAHWDALVAADFFTTEVLG